MKYHTKVNIMAAYPFPPELETTTPFSVVTIVEIGLRPGTHRTRMVFRMDCTILIPKKVTIAPSILWVLNWLPRQRENTTSMVK